VTPRPGRLGPALLPVLWLAAGSALGGTAADVELGERIFRDGVNGRGEPIPALVGLPPAPLAGAKAACGACHVLDADAAPSAPGAAPALRWAALAARAAARGARAPFNDAAFARAVSEGIAPDGGQLSAAMPRYSLSRSEIAALAAYLKAPPAAKKSG
jgi:mono/diheme cytochrome c family protein